VHELNISDYKMLIDKRTSHIPYSSLKFLKKMVRKYFNF